MPRKAQGMESFKGEELITEEGMKSTFVSDEEKQSRATDGPVDGGWWYRGKNGSSLVSEYKHYTKQGRGSCRNGNGTYNDGGWQSSGVFSKAKVGYTLLGGNKVYYDYREVPK